jgi:hypothetical protein
LAKTRATASIAMTDSSRTIERRPPHIAVGLGLTTVVMALAIGGAALDRPDAPLRQSPASSASPPVRSAPPAVVRSGDLRSVQASSAPDPTGTSGPNAAPDLAGRDKLALDSPPQPGSFAIDLFDEGDFVSQARVDWCVPASILTMMHMIDLAGDRKMPTQDELDRLARSLSSPRLRGAGSEPQGWAEGLNRLGYGPYEVRAEPTRAAAIAAAARAIRLTGRPVGLLIWRGAHAWVMSGFRATADPAYTDDFTVTHIYVQDPWYPRVSSIWGPSRPPDATVRVGLVAEEYLAWHRPTVRYPELDGQFVLVVPVVDTPALRSDHWHEPNDRARR